MAQGNRLEEIIEAVRGKKERLADPFAKHVNNKYGATALGLVRQEFGITASMEIAARIHSDHLSPDSSGRFSPDIFFRKLMDSHEWVDGIVYTLILAYAGIKFRGNKRLEPYDDIFTLVGASSLNPDIRPIGLEENMHLKAGLLLSNSYILRNMERVNENFSTCMKLWAELGGDGKAVLRRKTVDWYASYLHHWLGPELAVAMEANDCRLTQAALQAYFLYKGNPLQFGSHKICEANGSPHCEYMVSWNPDEKRWKNIAAAVLSVIPGIGGLVKENERFRRQILGVELKVKEYAEQVAELERRLGEKAKFEEGHGLLAGLHHHLSNPLANIWQYTDVLDRLLRPGIDPEVLAEQSESIADCIAEIKKSSKEARTFLELTQELVGATKPEDTIIEDPNSYWGNRLMEKSAQLAEKYPVKVSPELRSKSNIMVNSKLGLAINNIWLNLVQEFEHGNILSDLPIVVGAYDAGSRVQLSLVSPSGLDWEKVYSAILHANLGLDRGAIRQSDPHRLLQYLKNPLVSTKGSTGNGLSFATATVLGLGGSLELFYDQTRGFETRIYLPKQG